MKRREFTRVCGLGAVGWGLWPLASQAATLSSGDAAAGLRMALERGAIAAVATLGKTDGFLGNPLVRIALPRYLNDAGKVLRSLGQGRKLDELVTAMNRAAESAVPQAKPLLINAVKTASVEDALRVVRGGSTSVTDFFASKTRAPLTESFLPVVSQATEKFSLAERYNSLAGKAAGLGLVKDDEVSVQRYVTQRALNGLYLMIGEEEKKIRADPVKTGSDLLKRVFSSTRQ